VSPGRSAAAIRGSASFSRMVQVIQALSWNDRSQAPLVARLVAIRLPFGLNDAGGGDPKYQTNTVCLPGEITPAAVV
jgi:hypothetical protein